MNLISYGYMEDASNLYENYIWRNCTEDAIKYKKGPPESLYHRLLAHDIGIKDQNILILAANTGAVARRIAKQGCEVTAIDSCKEFIDEARIQSEKQKLKINFQVSTAESLDFKNHSFDVVLVHQALNYLNIPKVLTETKRLLVPGGMFVTTNSRWVPRLDIVAKKSEELILKYNPKWEHYDFNGEIFPMPNWAIQQLSLRGMFFYDEDIPYTKAEWIGRLKASACLGASLSKSKIIDFEAEMIELLDQITKDQFSIRHRIDSHIFQFK